MFVSLRMITLPEERKGEAPGLAARLATAAVGLAGACDGFASPAHPQLAFNAGDLVWRQEFTTEAEALAAPLSQHWRETITPLLAGTQVIGAGYQATRKGVGAGRGGIWRALVFRVWPHGFPHEARKLEQALLLMPRHVSTIRSWGLSTVATHEGPKAFTHVWEQEFDRPEGFTGEYMNHPIHWGLVDSWFDADCPQYIVDPVLSQPVVAIDRPTIA